MSGIDLKRELQQILATPMREAEHAADLERIDRIVMQRIHGETSERAPRVRKRMTLVLAAALVLLLASVAAAQSDRVREWFGDDPGEPANRMDVFQPQPETVPTGMRVFEVDAASDVDVERRREMLQSLARVLPPSDASEQGELLPEEYVRLLASAADGDFRVTLFGVPTTAGNVCYVVTTPNTSYGRCSEQLDDTTPITAAATSRQGRPIVTGIAIDEVDRVTIQLVDGSDAEATRGTNGFIWVGVEGTRPAAAIARLSSGETTEVEL